MGISCEIKFPVIYYVSYCSMLLPSTRSTDSQDRHSCAVPELIFSSLILNPQLCSFWRTNGKGPLFLFFLLPSLCSHLPRVLSPCWSGTLLPNIGYLHHQHESLISWIPLWGFLLNLGALQLSRDPRDAGGYTSDSSLSPAVSSHCFLGPGVSSCSVSSSALSHHPIPLWGWSGSILLLWL